LVTCQLCGERLADTGEDMAADMLEAMEHLRLFHPDQYEEPETWPDGSLVVEDQSLEPDDFG
jgi:hypothetical protein